MKLDLRRGLETLHADETGAMMQETDMDLPHSPPPDYGDLLELDLDDLEAIALGRYTNYSLLDLLNVDLLNESVVPTTTTALPEPDAPDLVQKQQIQRKRKKGQGSYASQLTRDPKPKRPKRGEDGTVDGEGTRGREKTRETQSGSPPLRGTVRSGPLPAGAVTLSSSPPPGVVQLSPSFHPSTHTVLPLQLLFSLANPTGTPTYILVPASSLHPQQPVIPPNSPVGGAMAPDLSSSSPPGSLSDCTSRALSPSSVSPLSPCTEVSPCKASPLCPTQSSPAPSLPQCVEDYILRAKAHMRDSCQEMEAGLSLAAHYVDMRLVQRQILIRSGRNANKCLEKELVAMGDVERTRDSLRGSQMFQNPPGMKPKRSIVLLGNAGMGKSTLIKKLCLDWSNGYLPQFDHVFVLDSKALTLTEPTYSLQTLLLHLSSSAPPCLHPETVFNQVVLAPERVLVIFDGFDDFRDYEGLTQSLVMNSRGQSYSVRQLFAGLLQRRLLPGCTLLLCARPRGIVSQLLRKADSLLELYGFSPTDIETYVSQYFTEASLRATAQAHLQNHSYLHSLCWNPDLCRCVCLVLGHSDGSEPLPSTLTELCHRVLRLKLDALKHTPTQRHARTHADTHTHTHSQSDTHSHKQTRTRTRTSTRAQTSDQTHVHTRSYSRTQTMEEEEEGKEEAGEEEERERKEEKELLSLLSSLALDGLRGHTSLLPLDRTISARLRGFGLRSGLLRSHSLRGRLGDVTVEGGGGEEGGGEGGGSGNGERRDADEISDDHVLSWAHPLLQSFLGGAHLSLSRCVSDRNFLVQTLPSPPRGRRRTQGEFLDLAQRFAIGLLFQTKAKLRHLVAVDNPVIVDTVVAKRASATTHLEGLHHGDLSPAQLWAVCHCVYETGDVRLAKHLAKNLPEDLSLRGVPLGPPGVCVLWNLLENCRTQRRGFSLGLEDTGVRVSGLRQLLGLTNLTSYRACIADVIALWKELEQSGEEELLKGAVARFRIVNPLKASQVCHIEHLAQLVHRHTHGRGPEDHGIPAVTHLHKLEFELGPVNGPLAFPMLLELLPALHNLQHLDLENSKIGDSGAEGLAEAVVSLSSLEILNLSQNCIGDQGVERLAPALCTLPSLHCLSLYSNEISDGGAESLAAVLPRMTSLTDLDVNYNKFSAVGAQWLGSSLRDCPWVKSLGMWNQCIPDGVFERLQQQDHRIRSSL